MAYENNNYVETRFGGGMDSSVEAHTLDRDTGELPYILNMQVRSQGLRVRRGWRPILDLSGVYSPLPTVAPAALFEYEDGLNKAIDESSGESGEDVSSETAGGGVVVPTDGGGNSVTGGGKGKEDDEEDEESVGIYRLSCANTPLMPYVRSVIRMTGVGAAEHVAPTSLTADRACTIGNIQGNAPVWTANVTPTVISSTLKSILFTARSGVAPGKGAFAYALYAFTPDLPATIRLGRGFRYTIGCQYNGATLSAYQGNGQGMTRTWEFLDENDQPVSGSVSELSVVWENGVRDAYAVATAAVTARKLRLTVSFAVQSRTDTADLEIEGCAIIAPASLHTMGEAKSLTIAMGDSEAETIPTISFSSESSGSASQALSLENGSYLDFSSENWSNGVWQEDVQATGLIVGELDIAASANGQLLATASITITDKMRGSISCGRHQAAGEPFALDIGLEGEDGSTLTRFSVGSVSVSLLDGSGNTPDYEIEGTAAGFSDPSAWVEGDWEGGDLCINDYGEFVLSVGHANGTEICSQVIRIVEPETQVLVYSPLDLHVYGEADELEIALLKDGQQLQPGDNDRPAISFEDEEGNSVDYTDYIETEDGEEIDFSTGWDRGEWRQRVRAKASAPQGRLYIRGIYTDSGQQTHEDASSISISRELAAEIDAPSTVEPTEDFELEITVTSGDGKDLPRLPTNGGVTVELECLDQGVNAVLTVPPAVEGGQRIQPSFSNFEEGVSSYEDCQIDQECQFEIRVLSGSDLLACEDITVRRGEIDLAALVEAINERFGGKGDNTTVTVNDSLSTIRSQAVACMVGYVNGEPSDSGTYTAYTSSSAGEVVPSLPANQTAEEVQEWIEGAYNAVVKAKICYVYAYNSSDGKFDWWASIDFSEKQSWQDEYENLETDAELRALGNRVLAVARRRARASKMTKSGGTPATYTMQGFRMFQTGAVSASYEVANNEFSVTPQYQDVGGTAMFYISAKKYQVFEKFGHDVPNEGEKKCYKVQFSAGETATWKNNRNPPFYYKINIDDVSYNSAAGYELSLESAFVQYNFRHR
ncbi:MAG: hypothetical protein IJJ33_04415 [Victivallales bacterium]|nr:hypothetical protein [Victivallales bacterium]